MKRTIIIILIALVICFAGVVAVTELIIPAIKYGKAESLFAAGQYEEAAEAFRALRRFKDSRERENEVYEAIKERDYSEAEKLLEKNDLLGAVKVFSALRDYKDSAARKEEILSENKALSVYVANKGDTVFFGSYEQDNDTSNGKEDIEWLVLAKVDDQILVISKYALDNQIYYLGKNDVTWDKCSLRTWLNETFLKEAFSDKERRMIDITSVRQDEKVKNPSFTKDAPSTNDRVFVLSVTEAKKYFKGDEARVCMPTAYAAAHGAYVNEENGGCWWWLRPTVGDFDSYTPAIVDTTGDICFFGFDVNSSDTLRPVRPAMWINIK